MMGGKAAEKIERVTAALEHRESDRVPVGEFFWSGFLRRARRELGIEAFDPYRHWDLDLIVVNPNMDPRIAGIELLCDEPARKVVRTGFGATIELHGENPMPHYNDFATKTWEQVEAFRFDDPADERRYFAPIDDQINSVGDGLSLNLPAWIDRLRGCRDDFAVFGSVCEPHELIWRIMGTENVMFKMGEDPPRLARFIERLGDFAVGIARAQIAAAEGMLTGLYIWGDVAYDRGMFFSPDYWRAVYQPQLKRICAVAQQAGLKTIYHGCGNATAIFDDIREAGIDAYNPLEAKAGLDVVELKRRYKGRWAFNGNIDARVLATNDRGRIRREVLRKLNAAKGGGYILQSDHSVPSDVAASSYDYLIELARQYGRYPLDLGEFDEAI